MEMIDDMIDIIKKFWRKLFKKQNLLVDSAQTINKNNEEPKESFSKSENELMDIDENMDVYSYLIEIAKSRDGYSEFEKSQTEFLKTKEEMSSLMEEVAKLQGGKLT